MSNRLSRGRVNAGWGRSHGSGPAFYEEYIPPLQYWEEFFIKNDHLGDDDRRQTKGSQTKGSQTKGSQTKGMYDVHDYVTEDRKRVSEQHRYILKSKL